MVGLQNRKPYRRASRRPLDRRSRRPVSTNHPELPVPVAVPPTTTPMLTTTVVATPARQLIPRASWRLRPHVNQNR